MKLFVSKLVAVQTVFFLFIVLYAIATVSKPEASAARYISFLTNGYTYPLALVSIAGLFAFAGIFRASSPIHLWVYLFPFNLYAGTALVSLIVHPDPSVTGMVNFMFIIALSLTFVWEKING